MSYLDLPRVMFSGDFQADVATVNNDARHFDNDRFEPVYQEFQTAPPANNGWFNPVGSGAFRLLGCRVGGAIGPGGPADPADPVRGARIGGSTDRVSAKIVDLDPQWQMASQLWGLRVELVAGGAVLLAGDFEPAAFRDIWMRGSLPLATARYQSVLRNLRWAEPGASPLLDQLRATTDDDLLSIRLTTSGYDGDRRSARFTLGAVTGAIGPHRRGEPRRFVAGRRFVRASQATTGSTSMNFFDGSTDAAGARLTVDLGNALPFTVTAGAVADPITMGNLGALSLGLLLRPDIAEGASVGEGTDVVLLGDPIPYRESGWLSEKAGILAVEVPTAVRAQLLGSALAVLRRTADGHRVLIRESQDGWLVRADSEVHRVEPGCPVDLDLYVTRFGRPMSGQRVLVRSVPPHTPGSVPPGPGVPEGPEPEICSPQTAFMIGPPVPTDAAGRTTRTLHCADPENPRGYIEGQLFQAMIDLLDAGGGIRPLPRPNSELLTVLVFSEVAAVPLPTWEDDVREIFTRYANLYPVMSKRLLDLSRYDEVKRHRAVLQLALSLDVGDPNHMPVTRDLPAARRKIILDWLATPGLPRGEPRPASPPGPERDVDAAPPTPDMPDELGVPVNSKELFARRFGRPDLAVEEPER